MQSKPTNPKDAIGVTKLPMHLVPSTLPAYASLAFLEGALKYGKYNWRRAGVRVSVYLDALDRHLASYKNGEWADPETRVPHLASALACIGIILDAYTCNMLIDDRPPAVGVGDVIRSTPPLIAHLKELFKDHHPHQHTIADDTDANTHAAVTQACGASDVQLVDDASVSPPVSYLHAYSEFVTDMWTTKPQDEDPERSLAIAGLGLGGESGEVTEHIKKFLRGTHQLNHAAITHELGDVIFYWMKLCNLLGLDPEMVIAANVRKLRARRAQHGNETKVS